MVWTIRKSDNTLGDLSFETFAGGGEKPGEYWIH